MEIHGDPCSMPCHGMEIHWRSNSLCIRASRTDLEEKRRKEKDFKFRLDDFGKKTRENFLNELKRRRDEKFEIERNKYRYRYRYR